MEKQPALVCNDGLELELDDTNNINEDTIYVTGFTVRWGQLSMVIEAPAMSAAQLYIIFVLCRMYAPPLYIIFT